MNKLVLIVLISLYYISASGQSQMGYPGWDVDSTVCSHTSDCRSRKGEYWCCAKTNCDTLNYRSSSSSCELANLQGKTDYLGISCEVYCNDYAQFVQVFGAALAFYVAALF